MELPNSYIESVKRFVENADWLTEEDTPSLIILRKLAIELDTGRANASVVAQFGLAHRALLKRQPKPIPMPPAPPADPLEDALGASGV